MPKALLFHKRPDNSGSEIDIRKSQNHLFGQAPSQKPRAGARNLLLTRRVGLPNWAVWLEPPKALNEDDDASEISEHRRGTENLNMRIALLRWESLHSVAVGGMAVHVTELAAALERRGPRDVCVHTPGFRTIRLR